MTSCPCCSHQLLRHIRPPGLYWFCNQCWAEMPNLPDLIGHQHQRGSPHQISKFPLMVLQEFHQHHK